MSIAILLADDHQIVRQGLRQILEAEPDFTVLGEAADGHQAVEMTERLQPDIVLLDIWMPRLSGVDATQRIKKVAPKTKVLILTMHKTRTYVEQVLRAGASGYLLKELGAAEVITAIRAVSEGQSYLSPSITQQVLDALANPGESAGPARLTEREREVLQNIAEGLSSREIASLLGLSLKTIEAHRAHMMEKLSIHKVSGLIRYAIREGMIAP